MESFPRRCYDDDSPEASANESELLNEYHVLLREADENVDGMCKEALARGRDLIAEIQTEQDFPPDYLANVTEKVDALKVQLESVERNSKKLHNRLEYLRKKREFYSELKSTSHRISLMEKCVAVRKQNDDENQSRVLEELESKDLERKPVGEAVQQVKRLAGEVALHPGAFEDPSNRVKEDAYNVSERLNAVEAALGSAEAEALVPFKRKDQHSHSQASMTSALERDLRKRLDSPLSLRSVVDLHHEISSLKTFLTRLDTPPELRGPTEDRIEQVERDAQQLAQFQEELHGMSVWMKEVQAFLRAEDPAFGDIETLQAQIKESDALQDDVQTLRPNVTVINETGQRMRERFSEDYLHHELEDPLKDVNEQWELTVTSAKEQNRRLKKCLDQSIGLDQKLAELDTFLDQLERDLPPEDRPVTQAAEMSQITYCLLQLKERVEQKQPLLQSLLDLSEERKAASDRLSPLQSRLNAITEKIDRGYSEMKQSSTEYGEFKTLFAQETDWLERLEKKLSKSAHTAADAEEISEELDDIENFLNNHPDERLLRLVQLAKRLSERNILISPVVSDAQRLKDRYLEVSMSAKQRTAILEGKTEDICDLL